MRVCMIVLFMFANALALEQRKDDWSIRLIMDKYSVSASGINEAHIPISYYNDARIVIRRPENETAAQFKRRILAAVQRPITFAGNYAIVVWSCGAGCTSGVIVNQKTDVVYRLPFTVTSCPYPEGPSKQLRFSPFSKILVVDGALEWFEGSDSDRADQECGQRFFLWTGTKLVRVDPDTKK